MDLASPFELAVSETFVAFDCHCEGDVEKVVVSGLPELPKGTAFEKMKFLRDHRDDIRLLLLREPRGSMIQSVNFIVPSDNPELPGITQTMFVNPVERGAGGLQSRNAVIVSPGRADRCPCGTGTCARLAVMHAKGEISVGETFIHKSIIDSTFSAEIVGLIKVGSYDAIIPAVSGRSWITAKCSYILERDDPFPTGYAITDTWPAMQAGSYSVTAKSD